MVFGRKNKKKKEVKIEEEELVIENVETAKKEETVIEVVASKKKVETKYVEVGAKINGKFHKSETYDLDDFVNRVIEDMDDDIVQSLKAYGKDSNLKANLHSAMEKMIDRDKKGLKLNKRK